MEYSEDTLKRELLESNHEFRSLFEQHQQFENRLLELRQKSILSQEDELEEKQIKRHKLQLKDKMEAILRSHRESSVSA